ncbi:hypothetical protein PCL_11534 [Purpureocillium lilacinum]|uniref:CVNH domain-containing protein n=1 Tax=Purpureocillium lilacinum TaxID=33203 RepID=A0A2U3EAB4_PURLI|nr:hypothetical protein Purlil1_2788 [Purpureocillium lilacinum]PWI71440.1 hypothetical protein PCL_11534 [Purpureocillium lilacinum]
MRSEFVFLPLYILFGAVRANGERTIQGSCVVGTNRCKVREVNYDASGNLIYDETITDNCAGTVSASTAGGNARLR